MALFSLVIVCLFHVVVGLLVFLKNPRSSLHRTFGLFVLAMVTWLSANYWVDIPTDKNVSLLLMYATFISSSLMIVLMFRFSTELVGAFKKHASWLSVLSALGLSTSLLGATPLVVQDIEKQSGLYAVIFGPLSPVYLVGIIFFFVATIVILFRSYRHSRGPLRARLQIVFLSLLMAVVLSLITNLVLPLLINDVSLVVWGPFSTIFISAGFSYAIIKHRLFDIRLLVARTLAYVLLTVTLAALYGFAVFGTSNLLFNQTQISTEQQAFNILLAIVLAFTFQPLRHFFERLTENIFYRDRYDSQEVLNEVGTISVSELILENLLQKSLQTICDNLKVESGRFLILDNKRLYKAVHYGAVPVSIPTMPELQKISQPRLIIDDLSGGTRKNTMAKYHVRASFALRTKDELVGYLMLGDKRSGDIFTSQDLQLLGILVNELAVSIANAKAYEKIATFNVTLQEKVDEATNRLRVVNHNLKALDRAKDEFISVASHQLRTPLTAVKGYLSMVMDGDAGKVNAEQHEYLKEAYESSERMIGLIMDLLNASRMSAGRFMIESKLTDLDMVVADEVRQLKQHAQVKHLELVYKRPKQHVPRVYLDEGKTRQVIMNFIDNAVYYTPSGTITVRLREEAGEVIFTVTDTGIGVPQASQKKMFTKFYRAGNAKKTRPDGTGLGLFLAKKVIEDQGGHIIFESQEGKGSTFGFAMPRKRRQHQ